MTVTELLTRIMAAYPGATNEAMKTFVPVFHARLKRHEGDALDTAAIEVLGSFKPKYDHKFPIPADFEAHLPSGRLNLPEENSIRGALADRAARKTRNMAEWQAGQGAKIKANRPQPAYNACILLAMELSGRNQRLMLSGEQIQMCEDRALAAARLRMFGPLPRTNEAHTDQIQQVRDSWTNNQQAAA